MPSELFSFNSTASGYNHIKNDIPCEDRSGCFDAEDLHICVVADGHGSLNYPRTGKGAEFAVSSAIDCVKGFAENSAPEELIKDTEYEILKKLAEDILIRWNDLVTKDLEASPFTEEELKDVSQKYREAYLNEDPSKAKKAYGTTLIIYVIWKGCSFGLQIGDGKCVVIDRDGSFSEPIPWDEECTFNITTSLCDDDALDEFRFHVSETGPAAVFCGSDGIDDSYADETEVWALYRSMLTILADHGRETFINEVNEYLPVLTKKGSGDDVSVAAVIDSERILLLNPILKLQAEIFKLETELGNKKDQLKNRIDMLPG